MTAATPARLRPRWVVAGVAAVLIAVVLGVAIGPVAIGPFRVLEDVWHRIPLIGGGEGLDRLQSTIVWDLRLPRVVLALLVGSMLSIAGASYQGSFRNPLADPYLLGAAAGAGLAVTAVIVTTPGALTGDVSAVPVAAFVGALVAVFASYALGRTGGSTPATLLLAGIAVTSFLTAIQAYLQQKNSDTIRQVYTWILGRLTTATWSDVLLLLPYFVVSVSVLLAYRRRLDVLGVGDAEATTLGIDTRRTRLIVVAAASLATAAAVSVSGLIGFVGIIVPHTVRLLAGASYRIVLPLSLLFGGAFLALADLAARTITSPAEIPIGVITAFVGAPFFLIVLRTSPTARA